MLTKLVRSCFASLYALWLLTLACFVALWHVMLTLCHSPLTTSSVILWLLFYNSDCRCSPSSICLPGLKAEVQKSRSEQPEVAQHSLRRSKIDFTSAQNLPGNPYLQHHSSRSNFSAAERKTQFQPYGSSSSTDSARRGSRPIGQSRWG